MVTFYHWGVHGWIPYTTMGAVMGILHYRRGLPMSVRFCFYPLIGEHVYGFLGDIIDILSIVTTIAGVCTSLGLGAMQLNNGLQRLDHGFYRGDNFNIPDDPKYSTPDCGGTGKVCAPGKEPYGIQVNVDTQITIIIIITLVATASVVTGVNRGIVNLSRVNFGLGMFLCLVVLLLGETYYVLDAIVQTVGYYLWYLLKIGFHTDAWERLGSKNMGLGGATDDKGGSGGWLTAWTLFYWGWWISWGPFCGTFLARISRGRTLRQFILGTLLIPTIYSCFWFGVFGAEGIRMQRLADGGGICSAAYSGDTSKCSGLGGQTTSKCVAYSAQYSDEFKKNQTMGWSPSCVLDPDYHGGYGKCKEFEWTRHVVVGKECVESTSWVSVPCGSNADPTALAALPTEGPCKGIMKMSSFNHFKKNNPECFKPAQDGIVCLYNQGTTDIFFDQLASYGPRGFSDLISCLGMIALFLYFVTSSDSGSMVVDMISANGHPDPPIPVRLFWSFTEGATAIALLTAGRNLPNSEGSLRALQSASLITGLPYTFILFWCAQSLYLLAKEESGDYAKDRKGFSRFILSFNNPQRLLINTLAPGVAMGNAANAIGGWPFSEGCCLFCKCCDPVTKILWAGIFQSMYLLAIIVALLGAELYQWCIVGLILYTGFAALLGFLRAGMRTKKNIQHGDLFTDLICAFALPMFTVTQIEEQMSDVDDSEKMMPATAE